MLGAAEAGLSPGGLFLGELFRRNPLPDSHDHRHHRGRIGVHEHDAGIPQLRIHFEIGRNAERAAVISYDMFSAKGLVAKPVAIPADRSACVYFAGSDKFRVFLVQQL
jgi:hypothetical protein